MTAPSTLRRLLSPAPSDLETDRLQAGVLNALFGEDVPTPRVDRFQILQRVGSGAMGTVFAAYDPKLDRRVALKVLHRSQRAGNQAHLVEARALAKLNHPAIVTVHDAGEYEGRLYVAMEFVEGESLDQRLRRHELDTAELLDVFRQAGEGLAAAHAVGVVHRDFKPANVMVGNDGRVRVADFGLASPIVTPRDISGEASATGSSGDEKTGAIVGTVPYMAPEQLMGRAADGRADQFAFCVALFEAVTGKLPFASRDHQARLAEIRAGLAPRHTPWRAPAWLLRLVRRGLAYDLADRFSSMEALLAELRGPRIHKRVLMALALGGVAAFGLGRVTQPGDPNPCLDAETVAQELWSPARAAETQQRFAATDVPFASQLFEHTSATLDDYAKGIARQGAESCRATWVTRQQSERMHDRRTVCLQHKRQSFEAVVSLLQETNNSVLYKLPGILVGLPDLTRCSRRDVLDRLPPLPSDPKTRDAISRMRAEIAEADTERVVRHDAALERLQSVQQDAERLGYSPLSADLALVLGQVLRTKGDYAAAEDALKRAFWTAQKAFYDPAAAEAAHTLARLFGTNRRDFDRAREWVEHARVLYARLGHSDDDIPAAIVRLEAELAGQQKRAEEARRWAELSLEVAGDDPGLQVVALTQLARALSHEGDMEAALARQEEALELVTRTYGAGHPYELPILSSLGVTLAQTNEVERGADHLRRAAALSEEIHGASHVRTAAIWHNLGMILDDAHNDEALARLADAKGVFVTTFGPRHRDVAYANLHIANRLHRAERYEEALRACDDGKDALGVDPANIELAMVALCRGPALAARGQYAEAAAVLEPFAQGRAPIESVPTLAQVEFHFGTVLYESGEHERGLGWIRGSIEANRTASAVSEGELSDPERWLAERGLD